MYWGEFGIFVTLDALAEAAELPEEQVEPACQALEADGYVEKGIRTAGGHSSTTYAITNKGRLFFLEEDLGR